MMPRTFRFRLLALGSAGLAAVTLAWLAAPLAAQQQFPPARKHANPAPAAKEASPPDTVNAPFVTAPMTERAARVWMKLQEPIAMNFATDTPLADIIKYIEQSTQDEKSGLPVGIPIYVDPQGLTDADKTMASTVAIRLEGIPLVLTLKLILKQLNLIYFVDPSGLLIVTSPEDAQEADPIRQLRKEIGELKDEVLELRRDLQAPTPRGTSTLRMRPANP